MEPIQIIRIETEDGRGPFNGGIDGIMENPNLRDLIDRHFSGDESTVRRFPSPHNESLNLWLDYQKWYCAFKTIEQLQSLFYPKELIELMNMRFNIYLLTVSRYQLGREQVLYTKESVLKKECINNLFL